MLAGALVGALTLGGAGMASAADAVTWGPTENVVIASGTETLAKPENAKSLTIESGATLAAGTNHVLFAPGSGSIMDIKGTITSNGGAIQALDNDTYFGSAKVTGTLTFTAGGSLSADSVAISGGASHKLSGKLATGIHTTRGEWRDGSQVYAGHDLTITGATVALGEFGLVGAGSSTAAAGQHLTIGAGGVVNMAGTSAANASAMHVFGDAVLNVQDGGQINVTGTGFGAIGSHKTVVSGANSVITVANGAHLEMIAKLPDGKAGGSRDDATAISDTGITFTSGAVELLNGGRIQADKGNFKAGDIKIDGVNNGTRSGIYDADGQAAAGVHVFGDATDHTGPTVAITNGGGIEGKDITINGGSFTIGGKGAFPDASNITEWRKGSLIVGDEKLLIAGGDITVTDFGQLVTGYHAQNSNKAGIGGHPS